MQLYHHLERSIKIPNNKVKQIYETIMYGVLDRLRFEHEIDSLEKIIGMTHKALSDVHGNNLRHLSSDSFVFMVGIDIDEIPYYHTSAFSHDKLLEMESGEVLVKCRTIHSPDSDYDGQFNINNDVLTINTYDLSEALGTFLRLSNNRYEVENEIIKLFKLIQHEMMHVIQAYALPEFQNSVNAEYQRFEFSDRRHADYYTSIAERMPLLASMQADYINMFVRDEYWEELSKRDKNEIFKMFVGARTIPLELSMDGTNITLTIPSSHYFDSFKSHDIGEYKKVVRDFYRIVSSFH